MELMEEQLVEVLEKKKKQHIYEISLVEFNETIQPEQMQENAAKSRKKQLILLSKLKYSKVIGITYRTGMYNRVETNFYLK